MKKNLRNLLVIALVICSLLSLSSCYLSDLGIELPSHSEEGETDGGKGGDTYIRVDGGDNYDITITPQTGNDILAASKALLSSVSVFCTFEAEKTYFGKPTGQTTTYTSAGSGVIYKLDKNKGCAYIITNYHVLYNAEFDMISNHTYLYLYGARNHFSLLDSKEKRVIENGVLYETSDGYLDDGYTEDQIGDQDGDGIKATYVGGAMDYDIAILKVEGSEYLRNSAATISPQFLTYSRNSS